MAEYLLLRQRIDLGVIDIGLPTVDGLTIVKRVRAARPTLPLLVLTALDGMENRVAGLNAGADDYLTKPFDFPGLEARINALLRRAQAAQHAPPPTADRPSVQLAWAADGVLANIDDVAKANDWDALLPKVVSDG